MSRGDYHLYVLMHELAHFVDDEKRVEIADPARGWQDKYTKLPHHLCLRNADCYALLAFEYFAGQDRMRAIYPNLPIEIYTDVT